MDMLSTTEVKVVQFQSERNRLSRVARDGSDAIGDNSGNGAEPEDTPLAQVEREIGPAAASPAPAETSTGHAKDGHKPVKLRIRQQVRPRSPAAVLARSLARSEPPRIQDLLQVFERHLDRAPAADCAPAVPIQKESAEPEPGADEDGFWETWLEHRDYLHRYSVRFSGGNLADAEDALSEAMLKAARTFSRTKIRNHRAWLLRLVHNACMDRHRSNRRHTRVVQDIKDVDSLSAPAVAVQPERSPEDLLVAFQQLEGLQRALSALPAFLVEPLMLHLDDRPDAEIASALNVTREVIRKRRQIARAMLRRQLSF